MVARYQERIVRLHFMHSLHNHRNANIAINTKKPKEKVTLLYPRIPIYVQQVKIKRLITNDSSNQSGKKNQ